MKRRLLGALLSWLSLLSFGARAQTNVTLATETFEGASTDLPGYTSNTSIYTNDNYSYFDRRAFSGNAYPGVLSSVPALTNKQGSYTWACEHVRGDNSMTVRSSGYVVLNPITNSASYKNFVVTVAFAAPRGGTFTGAGSNGVRSGDRIRVQYSFNGGSWTTAALLMGNNRTNVDASDFERIVPLSDTTSVSNGNVPANAGTILDQMYRDISVSLPSSAIGPNLRVRVVADFQDPEVAFDNIRVTGVLDNTTKPTLNSLESTPATYTEGGSPTQLTSNLVVGYSDNSATNITSATVSVSSAVAGQDMLNYNTLNGITGNTPVLSNGVLTLTLTGTTTQANYQAALRSITYSNSNTATLAGSTRTISFTAFNGSTSSGAATRSLTITPVLNAGTLNYTEDFNTDGEGTRYFGNSFFSQSEQVGFFRATTNPPTYNGFTVSTRTYSGYTGAGFWYGEGTEIASNPSSPYSTLQLAPLDATNRTGIKFTIALGAGGSWGGYFSPAAPGGSFELYYRTSPNGTLTKFASFYGNSSDNKAHLDADGDITTPATGTALTTALQDFTFTLPAAAAASKLEFLLRLRIGGDVELAFDNIRISSPTTVNSITRASPNPTNAATVNYTVTFGAPVTGLTASNFSLTTSGLSGASLGTPTQGTGNTWTVPVTTGTGSGTLTLNLANSTNLSYDISTTLPFAGETYTIDKTAPTVTSVTVPANGNYRAGQTLSFTVNFSEAVTVTGTPQLALTIGSTTRQAGYASGSGTTALVFTYTVQSGDLDTNGITLASALTLNGGTIQDAGPNNANLTLNNVPATTGVLVDAVAPTVTLSSTVANNGSTTTSPVNFTAQFSESVGATFTIGDITVSSGSTVGNFAAGSAANSYTFTVTPAAGTVSVSIAAGVAQDAAGNNNTAATPNPYSFTYQPAPTLSSLTPPSGPVGTSVTLTGTGFVAGSTVSFNGTAASSVTFTSATSLTALVPAGATSGSVIVTANGSTSNGVAFTVTVPQLAVSQNGTSYPSGGTAYNFGTVTQGSTSSPVIFTLTNAGNAPLTLSGIAASGDYAVSGPVPTTVAAGGGTATVSATFTPTAAGTRPGTLIINSNAGAYTLNLTGTGVLYPDLTVSTGSASSPVSVPAGTYGSLTVTGTGYARLSGVVVVNNSVTVQTGGTLLLNCQVLSGSASFTLAAGATLGICDAAGISSSGATGGVQVTGLRSFSADALYLYNGTTAQVTGSGLPATVRSLTLSNAAGLTLTSALTATASVILSSGQLRTGAAALTLGPAATLSETAGGYVTGTVQTTRSLVTAGSPESFGGLGLTLTPSGATLPGSTLVRRVTGTALTGQGTSQSVRRYFAIEPATKMGLNVALVLTVRDDELGGIAAANLRLFKSDDNGASWQLQAAATYGAASTGSLTTYSASLGGISNFSLWTLGDVANPLPVKLVAFAAQAAGAEAVQLTWTTASELNSARFEVERALDGQAFAPVGQVAAHGSSSTATSYAYRDAALPGGVTRLYYRLRQVDLDGSFAYSPVRVVELGSGGLMLFPNPVLGRQVTLRGAEAGQAVQVYDSVGRLVLSATTDAHGTAGLALPANLPEGVYVVRVGAQALRLAVD